MDIRAANQEGNLSPVDEAGFNNQFTESVEPGDIRIIIWGPGTKRWLIRNWERIIPEAKEVILNGAKKARTLDSYVT